MSARITGLMAALLVLAGWTTRGLAQESTEAPQVENSRFQFAGVVKGSAVRVHSGPGENYYPTTKLDKGTPVTVMGIKFDWLKIVPPEGSFSIVGKAYIKRQGESSVGEVIAETPLNVRAGSLMNNLRVTIQCKLKKGDTVTIIGDEQSSNSYRIKPPADAFLYIHKDYVDPVKAIGANALATTAPVAAVVPPVAGVVPVIPSANGPAAEQTIVVTPPVKTPANPADAVAETTIALPPATTQPTEEVRAEIEFDRLEMDLKAMADKSLEEQPIAQWLAGYQALLRGSHLPVTMRRMSEMRVANLTAKNKAKEELLAWHKSRDESNARLAAIEAERKAVEQRMGSRYEVYTAVGLMQASSLQLGAQTIYRLTDPANGRTLCYVRNNDPKYVKAIGQFVGVKGELTSDPQLNLKVVNATDIAVVDASQVGKGLVTAPISPPSLIPGKNTSPTTAPAQ